MRSLGEIFRKASDSKSFIANTLSTSEQEVIRLASDDPFNLWTSIKSSIHDNCLTAKLYYYHQGPDSPLWAGLAQGEDRIVHLLRRNLFDAFLSREIVTKFKLWNTKNAKAHTNINLCVFLKEDELAEYIETKISEIYWVRKKFEGYPHYHEVFFEDISLSSRVCMAVTDHIFGDPANGGDRSTNDVEDSRIKSSSNVSVVENYRDVAHYDRIHVY